MTMRRMIAVLSLSLLICASWRGADGKEKKKNDSQGSDTQRLIAAAQSCDLPMLKTLIASGVNLSATDENGMDALSYASFNREQVSISASSMLFSHGNSNTHAKWTHMQWTLKCPLAVSALTDAGADPWKARFYQNPRLDETRPSMIAIIRVEDDRSTKGDSNKLLDQMTDGIETQLRASHAGLSQLEYPIIGLNEVRQKLLASGFSQQETMSPDRAKACKALAVDSVFEARLEDYRSSTALQNLATLETSATTMRMNFSLTDCATGALLWRSDRDYPIVEGWLVRAFAGSKAKQAETGVVGQPAVSFPPYEGGR